MGVINRDTRSLDYSSHQNMSCYCLGIRCDSIFQGSWASALSLTAS